MIENKEMKKMMCDFDKVYVSGRQVGVDIIPRKIDNYTAETDHISLHLQFQSQ